MVHCSSVPTPLARRTRLVSAPAVVYDMTQPKYDTAGALASALQRYGVTRYNGIDLHPCGLLRA